MCPTHSHRGCTPEKRDKPVVASIFRLWSWAYGPREHLPYDTRFNIKNKLHNRMEIVDSRFRDCFQRGLEIVFREW